MDKTIASSIRFSISFNYPLSVSGATFSQRDSLDVGAVNCVEGSI